MMFALLTLAPYLAFAHVWTLCPEPRRCRVAFDTSFKYSTNDGPVRQNPCGQEPAATPPTTLVAGDTFCLRYFEYVPHPHTMRVSYSKEPQGRNGDKAVFENETNILATVEHTKTVQAGYKGITVTIPADLECERCTIQLYQFATDLNYHYYDCVDVKIVQPGTAHPVNSSQCRTRLEAGTCEVVVKKGVVPSYSVYSLTVYAIFPLIWVLFWIAAAIVYRCRCRPADKPEMYTERFWWVPNSRILWGAFFVIFLIGAVLMPVLPYNARNCVGNWEENWETQ